MRVPAAPITSHPVGSSMASNVAVRIPDQHSENLVWAIAGKASVDEQGSIDQSDAGRRAYSAYDPRSCSLASSIKAERMSTSPAHLRVAGAERSH